MVAASSFTFLSLYKFSSSSFAFLTFALMARHFLTLVTVFSASEAFFFCLKRFLACFGMQVDDYCILAYKLFYTQYINNKRWACLNGIFPCRKQQCLDSWLLTLNKRRFHQPLFLFFWRGGSNCLTRRFQLFNKLVQSVQKKNWTLGQLEPPCRQIGTLQSATGLS